MTTTPPDSDDLANDEDALIPIDPDTPEQDDPAADALAAELLYPADESDEG
jgi:hypothetical protein